MKYVLHVGASLPSLRDGVTSNGYGFVSIQDTNLVRPDKRTSPWSVYADFKSNSQFNLALDKLAKEFDIKGVINTYENYIRATAMAADHLHLRGLSIESASKCTDKYLMRTSFYNYDKKITPAFREVKEVGDLLEFAKEHGYPLILKPANLAKSLLILKCRNQRELIDSYNKMLQLIGEAYAKYAPHQDPKILIEQFISGHSYTVEAFIDDYRQIQLVKQIADIKTGQEAGFDDNFLYSRCLPSTLNSQRADEILEVAEKGIRALRIKNCPAHVDIVLSSDGPKIIEIGARIGGYRQRMYQLASGIDMTRAQIQTAVGEGIDINATKNYSCAVIELFPRKSGTFKKVAGEKSLLELSSLNYYKVRQEIGTRVGKSSSGYKMCAVVILYNPNYAQLRMDMDLINDKVSIVTD